MFELKNQVFNLLKEEPFLAAVSRNIDKIESKATKTAGVRFNKQKMCFEMMYNQDYINNLEPKYYKSILMHEIYHIILGHCTGRKMFSYNDDQWNFSVDLATNSIIGKENVHESWLIPEHGPFKNYPLNLNAEVYYKMIEADPNIKKIKISCLDDHSGWYGNEGENNTCPEILEDKLKKILKKAVEQCAANNSWGSIPQNIIKDILNYIKTNINWESLIRYFVKQSRRLDKNNSVRKINKRFPYIYPGKKVRRIANVAISMDQSGSVSDTLLTVFYSVIDDLSDLVTFTVIPFDCEVDEENIFVWKKGERRNWKRYRSGGTNFDSPTKWVNERNFDGHIILTDLQAEKPIPSKCQRMWLTDLENYEHPYFKTNELVVPIVLRNS